MECKQKQNSQDCPCTYTSCGKHGVCCDCLRSHLSQEQLPACVFPDDVARTSERSISKFVELYQNRPSWF